MNSVLLPLVPDGEGEHAVEALQAAFAPLLPGVDDHLRVAAGAEGVSACQQLALDLHEVEDLAVEGHDDSVVLVVERLLAALEVDDRQAPMTETDAGLEVKSVAVRASMAERRIHRLEHPLCDRDVRRAGRRFR